MRNARLLIRHTPVNLPRTVDICETEVNLDNLFKSEGLLTDSLQSKSILENEIIHNSECTGFLISFLTRELRACTRASYRYDVGNSIRSLDWSIPVNFF